VVAIITPSGGIKNLWDLQVRICRAVGAISGRGRMKLDFLDTEPIERAFELAQAFPQEGASVPRRWPIGRPPAELTGLHGSTEFNVLPCTSLFLTTK
jgi:hypothetical protein